MIPRCSPCRTRRGLPGRCGGACLDRSSARSNGLRRPNRFPLAIDRLGAVFNRLLETNQFQPLQLSLQIEAAPTLPDVPPLAVLADHSIVQLEG